MGGSISGRRSNYSLINACNSIRIVLIYQCVQDSFRQRRPESAIAIAQEYGRIDTPEVGAISG